MAFKVFIGWAIAIAIAAGLAVVGQNNGLWGLYEAAYIATSSLLPIGIGISFWLVTDTIRHTVRERRSRSTPHRTERYANKDTKGGEKRKCCG